jgi:Dolichyl-phosphate-mannose-protein mannosyltransferase
MTATAKMRTNITLAALAGLGLRVFFLSSFPAAGSEDSPFYIELAWNWLRNGVYGFPVFGHLTPVDMRMPGYPAFLAAVFAFAGQSMRAVMLAQVFVDLATCFLIALIASRLAPAPCRSRVTIAAFWLAALCPFTANYTATVLTETLVTFFTALAILTLLEALAHDSQQLHGTSVARRARLSSWFLGGIVVGFGTLVRPETPLLLVAAGLALAGKWRHRMDWTKLLRAAVLMGLGLLLPLVPWATRNWRTLHEVQFLAPRYSLLPGEFEPLGFDNWTKTWLWRFGDVYETLWKINVEPISLDAIRASAFDSPQERSRISNLLDQYNNTLTITREQDIAFGEIARERTARHPLRTYLRIPLLRSFTLWFTPRVELLPVSGRFFPVREEWEDDRADFFTTLGLALVNGIYVALALAGAWVSRRRPGWAFLILFILVRTAFFAGFVEAPEPRYVLECFPAVLALGAQVFCVRGYFSSTGSG